MAKRIAVSNLVGSTINILNVIRQNASLEYQSSVPTVTQATDIPRVGEVIYGTPAFANQFVNALVNRIALVKVQSATFNNPYGFLKKGYLEFGETVEDIFVNIARVMHYDPEKAASRELKNYLPDIRSEFHTMNWRVMYPVTIRDEDLKLAFLSEGGVLDLIANIVDQVYTADAYDEFLLFKYMLIKAVNAGQLAPVSVGATLKTAAAAFRGTSNKFTFMSKNYNIAQVKNNAPRERQVIFMDTDYDAAFDVEILAAAFHMDKAEYLGRRVLIDDWTSFDNDRFAAIRSESDGLEEVTSTELTLMGDVKAILLDENWFQIYDNLNKFTETYVASGLSWNYFYHVWKTVSSSPFANAVVFVASTSDTLATIDELTFTVSALDVTAKSRVVTFELTDVEASNVDVTGYRDYQWIQNEDLIAKEISVHPYGALIMPVKTATNNLSTEKLTVSCGGTVMETSGIVKTPAVDTTPAVYKTMSEIAVGDTITFTPPAG